jgi:hypothetical protein
MYLCGNEQLHHLLLMFLKPHQMYLESQGLYQKVCRLAQVRTAQKVLRIEEDLLVRQIEYAMAPATEVGDLSFLRSQKDEDAAVLQTMFVARREMDGALTVHPAYVSERFRPGGMQPDIPLVESSQLEFFAEKEEESNKEEKREVVVIEKEKDDDEEKATDRDEEINTKGFVLFFNQCLEEQHSAIPHMTALTGERLKALRARCREHGKEQVVKVIRMASSLPFLNGAGDKGWVASIDWLLKPNNFTKVLEGTYNRFKPRKGHWMTPERAALIREVEEQQHEELHRRLDEQRRNAVTYEEYVRMRDAGEV